MGQDYQFNSPEEIKFASDFSKLAPNLETSSDLDFIFKETSYLVICRIIRACFRRLHQLTKEKSKTISYIKRMMIYEGLD